MKKRLIELWNSETPAIARFLQGVLGAVAVGVAALFVFWGSVPEEFKAAIGPEVMKAITYAGGISALGTALLQFTKKKDK